jgi:hypothetical protein
MHYLLYSLMVVLWALNQEVARYLTFFIGTVLGVIAYAIVICALGAGALLSQRRSRRIKQKHINDEAQKIVRSVCAGKKAKKQFTLFLRPFLFDGALTSINLHKSSLRFTKSYWTEDEVSNIDELIRRMANLSVIKIGSMLDDIGSGVSKSADESWLSVFQKLAHSAAFIVIVPFATPSSKVELLYLKNSNLLDKCLFVLTPITRHKWMSETDADWIGQNQQHIWQHSLRKLHDVGVELPAVQPPCLFFLQQKVEKSVGFRQN